ncbi:hypothetical protein LINGRAHAP2_LOCUS4783 [Linum grandiflorum]
MEDHLNSIDATDPVRKQDIHKSQFQTWFQDRMTCELAFSQGEHIQALHSLSCGPSLCVSKYTGCIINVVRFHSKDRENRRKTQNSGVVVEGNHLDEIIDFYGVLTEVIQLDYVRDKHVYLFKCDWYDVDGRKSRIVKDCAITSVRVDKLWYSSDPFALANQAKQVFYINDPKHGPNWRVMYHFTHRHIFIGDMENDIVDVMENEDAYQDEEEPNVELTVAYINDEMEMSLQRVDVEAEVVFEKTVTNDKETHSQFVNDKIGEPSQDRDDEGYFDEEEFIDDE